VHYPFPRFFPFRVLIADHYRDAADSLAAVLSLRGIDARVAYSGREALQVAGYFHPHVLLSEVVFPDMDGAQLARRLGSKAVLIAMTAHDAGERSGRTSGFQLVLSKPCAAAALCRLLDRLEKHVLGPAPAIESHGRE
jgi:DNA-binding response OmpR family regulator